MNLSSLFPPTIVARLLDDLGAIADAARRLPEIEHEVLKRVDSMQTELQMVRTEISAVRVGVETLGDGLDQLGTKLDALRGDVQPIKEITKVREGVGLLSTKLDGLREDVKPIREIGEVRKGIEPLDEDMRAVRHSVDDLEPLIRGVIERLDSLRAELGPLGELADKIPGIGR